ncbi:hypothetical protein ACFQ3P_39580 [Paraburkholderia sabiae]|uniref:Uncharacterized protein n=1 Tax=Paraburkholderia sabiae TaxID=273251 RepID=A0ABU9QRS6_9BURK|nr:hypothetical protein [Paraburkholderia sabiae]WJZ75046.1 hypothetical protein QEN71_04315 [Paraburkholderia sabiae]CAD6552305.1 hypothetical protein LMG24235_05073 [Paraburkholderia sabiae]
MRLVFRIDSNPIPLLPVSLAVCVAIALAALPAGANAQESISAEPAVSAAQQATDPAADETSNVAATADSANIASETETNSAQVLSVPADGAAMSDIALDDQVLSRQRGGAVGMVMVAATPQLVHGSSVTLWDEIAPPSPLPIPIDAARAAQGNVANYQRK